MFQTYVVKFSYECRISSDRYIPVNSSYVCRLSDCSKGQEHFKKVFAPWFFDVYKNECRFLQFLSCEFILNFLED